LIAALFVSAVAVHAIHGTADAAAVFVRSIFTLSASPALPKLAVAHIITVGVFLAYFPATHMTHAYMKFFTYHRVRWDDTPAVHDVAMGEAMNANVQRPITWAAPHISREAKNTWVDAVAGGGRRR
jgi:hypothetical protein